MAGLAGWKTFFEIVGTSAGALIGLEFVALTLVAEMRAGNIDRHAGAAFATPAVVRFSSVLLLAAALSAPWRSALAVEVVLGLGGIAGVLYSLSVARHLLRQGPYKPGFADWMFHALLPTAAYVVLAASAWAARTSLDTAMFWVAGTLVLVLFIGIHNVWDVVTYHMFTRGEPKTGSRTAEEETKQALL